MVFNATFNIISVISWRSVLLMEETGVPGENHRPVANHWQTWSLNVVFSTHRLSRVRFFKNHWLFSLEHTRPCCCKDVYNQHILQESLWRWSYRNCIHIDTRLCDKNMSLPRGHLGRIVIVFILIHVYVIKICQSLPRGHLGRIVIVFILIHVYVIKICQSLPRGHLGRMVVEFTTNYRYNQCLLQIKLSVRIRSIARCTRYNFMWYSLSVTCDRSMIFSGFLHQ
jgi:hypothetical protein